MLTENDVIKAVASHLKENGWCIERVSRMDQRGADIFAKKGRVTFAIEAKGGTSTKPKSRRHGKPFNTSQKESHLSRALYTAARVVSEGKHRAGIALPADPKHTQLIEAILPALKMLKIRAFMVEENRNVRELH